MCSTCFAGLAMHGAQQQTQHINRRGEKAQAAREGNGRWCVLAATICSPSPPLPDEARPAGAKLSSVVPQPSNQTRRGGRMAAPRNAASPSMLLPMAGGTVAWAEECMHQLLCLHITSYWRSGQPVGAPVCTTLAAARQRPRSLVRTTAGQQHGRPIFLARRIAGCKLCTHSREQDNSAGPAAHQVGAEAREQRAARRAAGRPPAGRGGE